MIAFNLPRIRKLLRDNPDGLSTNEIKRALNLPDSVRKSLSAMPDVYIDRWAFRKEPGRVRGRMVAIWCAVEVPENCPRPTPKRRRKSMTSDISIASS